MTAQEKQSVIVDVDELQETPGKKGSRLVQSVQQQMPFFILLQQEKVLFH